MTSAKSPIETVRSAPAEVIAKADRAGEVKRPSAAVPAHGRGSRKVDARGVSVAPGVLRSGREISASAPPERIQVGPASMVGGRVGAGLGPEGSGLPVPIASFMI
jgi:hypothetical protein